MTRKLAIKRLRSSDLSFFHSYLHNNPQTKQKSFNLDRRIIESTFFPSLTEVVDALPGRRALVALTIYGPGLAGAHQLARKILKQEKNWRLNGELVYNPEDMPGRYDDLAPEDFALFEFNGTGAPSAVKVVLISAANEQDASLHKVLSTQYPSQSMATLGERELEQAVSKASPDASHPVWDWLDRDLIEDVGQGSGNATQLLNHRRQGRGISLAELQNSKASAERVGLLGEDLLNHFFQDRINSGVISHQWASQINAISPFDFHLETQGGSERRADAKSTAGPFRNPIHLSFAEILFAVHSSLPYDIYRLFEVREGYAKCRIAKNISPKLKPILDSLTTLPTEVSADSLSFNPSYFDFEEPFIEISTTDETGEYTIE
jgi:hypothetical protein